MYKEQRHTKQDTVKYKVINILRYDTTSENVTCRSYPWGIYIL